MAILGRVCVMRGGIMERQGMPEKIYKNRQTGFAARFVGHYNVLTYAEAGKAIGLGGSRQGDLGLDAWRRPCALPAGLRRHRGEREMGQPWAPASAVRRGGHVLWERAEYSLY